MISRRIIVASVILLAASVGSAYGFGFGRLGNGFGSFGASRKGSAQVAPGGGGKLLAVDGTSYILQTDGVSKICLAGGC